MVIVNFTQWKNLLPEIMHNSLWHQWKPVVIYTYKQVRFQLFLDLSRNISSHNIQIRANRVFDLFCHSRQHIRLVCVSTMGFLSHD